MLVSGVGEVDINYVVIVGIVDDFVSSVEVTVSVVIVWMFVIVVLSILPSLNRCESL